MCSIMCVKYKDQLTHMSCLTTNVCTLFVLSRKEYVKCRKEICEYRHGPYYYAYWKDPESKKLKKKYVGIMPPKDKPELKNDNCNVTKM